ncbi:R-spondin-4-like isoform X2 [Portunus trituberculatus]|uniref:R-spondin-4-like isoform X2 n=1 Tax=Portunus trituberculatus TaxID=210409 RepID=UPI001E1CF3B9|nr:R-spondin-4-like isoform X2 [Portunus trituberculatus]
MKICVFVCVCVCVNSIHHVCVCIRILCVYLVTYTQHPASERTFTRASRKCVCVCVCVRVHSRRPCVAVDVGCAAGCTLCSPMNGCLSCEAPYFLMLHRDGARQTASCAKTCPRGFFKVRKKRNGFCTKCTMLGCEECLGPHYCSTCQQHYFNYFGKCIRETAGNSSTDPHMSTTLTKTMTKEEEEEEGEGGEGRRRR